MTIAELITKLQAEPDHRRQVLIPYPNDSEYHRPLRSIHSGVSDDEYKVTAADDFDFDVQNSGPWEKVLTLEDWHVQGK